MHNITLIATIHTEHGKCNSDELYKIIESINPDVIFVELTSELFDDICNTNLLNLPPHLVEINCIKKYMQNYNIEHIPVDIETGYITDKEQDWMYDTFEKYEDYNKMDNQQSVLTVEYGFNFLNSNECLYLSAEKDIIIKNILRIDIDKDKLSRVHQLFNKHNNIRENAMLQNIYNYSKENPYKQAVFLIGAAHKKSVIQKIGEFEKSSGIQLNWKMYGDN